MRRLRVHNSTRADCSRRSSRAETLLAMDARDVDVVRAKELIRKHA
jgi:hypothetical protein